MFILLYHLSLFYVYFFSIAPKQRIQSAMPKKPTAAPTYTVWDGKRGKTFATAGEASGYAEEYRKKTGEILTITQTKRKATHEYGKQSKK